MGNSDFVVGTQGHCFLCRDKIELENDVQIESILESIFKRNQSANQSIQYISRYLKMDMSKVFISESVARWQRHSSRGATTIQPMTYGCRLLCQRLKEFGKVAKSPQGVCRQGDGSNEINREKTEENLPSGREMTRRSRMADDWGPGGCHAGAVGRIFTSA